MSTNTSGPTRRATSNAAWSVKRCPRRWNGCGRRMRADDRVGVDVEDEETMNNHMNLPASRVLTTLGACVIAAVAAIAVAQTAPPASAPAPVVNQHGPTIKDAYAKSFLIGMAGDIPGNYSDVELG